MTHTLKATPTGWACTVCGKTWTETAEMIMGEDCAGKPKPDFSLYVGVRYAFIANRDEFTPHDTPSQVKGNALIEQWEKGRSS